jgi:hypothetical protein
LLTCDYYEASQQRKDAFESFFSESAILLLPSIRIHQQGHALTSGDPADTATLVTLRHSA